MRSLVKKIMARFGAFIAVMAVCYGMVMAGAWHSSVVAPTLHVSFPSFSVAKKASSAKADLHAKKEDSCRLPGVSSKKPDACDTSKMCGRHDCDSSDAPSLYCGCHSHGDSHAGSTADGAPHTIPSVMERTTTIIAGPSPANKPSARRILIAAEIDHPPSILPA
ncbi:MAG: hypothetical protein OEV28_07650 [Nitrospirota bacterium]|nr:hypothetical protein [Nitrospirota bacterium]